MKYIVTVSNIATYTIDADNEWQAKNQAEDWFYERNPAFEIKEIPECRVELAPLQEVLESWVQTFNDCACCPCEDCPLSFGVDTCDCANRIIATVLKAEEVE